MKVVEEIETTAYRVKTRTGVRRYFTKRSAYYGAAKQAILSSCQRRYSWADNPGLEHFGDHNGFDQGRWTRTCDRLAKLMAARDLSSE